MKTTNFINEKTVSIYYLQKRKLMEKTAGAFKGTELAKESVWKEVLKRKSRKTDFYWKQKALFPN